MARPKTDRLEYYNQDTADGNNLQFVEAEHGLVGYAVVHKLWKHIYGGDAGYYCLWNDMYKALFCKNNNIQRADLDAILNTCFLPDVAIFDKEMADKFGVLTSKGVQKRWLHIVKQCGRKSCKIDEKYNLLPLPPVNLQETTPPLQLTDSLQQENCSGGEINLLESAQSKVKERKVKESKMGVNSTRQNFFTKKGGKENVQSEKGMLGGGGALSPPVLQAVDDYFKANTKAVWSEGTASAAALKFHRHYKGLGWKTVTGAAIEDWQAAADKWIIEDIDRERKQQNGKPKPFQRPPNDMVKFTNDVYSSFLNGDMGQDNLPTSVYDFLAQKQLLLLHNDEKVTLMYECNGDEALVKKKAVFHYFTGLKKQQNKLVFELNNVS